MTYGARQCTTKEVAFVIQFAILKPMMWCWTQLMTLDRTSTASITTWLSGNCPDAGPAAQLTLSICKDWQPHYEYSTRVPYLASHVSYML